MASFVIIAGIHDVSERKNTWGIGDEHSGAGYAALHDLFKAEKRVLKLSPYGPSLLKGATGVPAITAGDAILTRTVRERYLPAVEALVRSASSDKVRFFCHSGGGLVGLMLAARAKNELKLSVDKVVLIETPYTEELTASPKLAPIVMRRVAFESGLKLKMARFRKAADRIFPGGHTDGMAGRDCLAYLRAEM